MKTITEIGKEDYMLNCLSVGLGGFAGSILRYILGISLFQNSSFPCATLLINFVGAFSMGILTQLFAGTQWFPPRIKLLLTTGFLGGFTTFSTFSLETVTLFEIGKTATAFLYAGLSVLLCLAGVFLGKAFAVFLMKI